MSVDLAFPVVVEHVRQVLRRRSRQEARISGELCQPFGEGLDPVLFRELCAEAISNGVECLVRFHADNSNGWSCQPRVGNP